MMEKKERDIKVTHLKCREIQAPIVSSLIKAFADKVGYDKAIEIVEQVVREDAVLSGRTLADKYGKKNRGTVLCLIKGKTGGRQKKRRGQVLKYNKCYIIFAT